MGDTPYIPKATEDAVSALEARIAVLERPREDEGIVQGEEPATSTGATDELLRTVERQAIVINDLNNVLNNMSMRLDELQSDILAIPTDVTDDDAFNPHPHMIAGDGVHTIMEGETVEFRADAYEPPPWYISETCDCGSSGSSGVEYGAVPYNSEVSRNWLSDVVWDEEEGKLMKHWDVVTLRNGLIYKISENCGDIIVEAESCTELVDPECPE